MSLATSPDMMKAWQWSSATTVAVLGPLSMTPISPKKLPSLSSATSLLFTSITFTEPLRRKYRSSESSPFLMITVPGGYVAYFIVDIKGRSWKECIQDGKLVISGPVVDLEPLVLATPWSSAAGCLAEACWPLAGCWRFDSSLRFPATCLAPLFCSAFTVLVDLFGVEAFLELLEPGFRGLYVPWFCILRLWSNQNFICFPVSTNMAPFFSVVFLLFLLSLIRFAISWQASELGVLFALNFRSSKSFSNSSNLFTLFRTFAILFLLPELMARGPPFPNQERRRNHLPSRAAKILRPLVRWHFVCPFVLRAWGQVEVEVGNTHNHDHDHWWENKRDEEEEEGGKK
mmetsp:Transcript_12221/g.33923  ORF Transcript_12221/g.33923 Transcript_12221/m.33923 type:complete len:344 (+) Transcript_12221:675-1706(+)